MADLAVERVGVSFGGVQALLDVDLTVRPASVTGLIGPNGAGKTTLFNVITGLQAPTRGVVRFDGRDITKLRPHRRARLGIGRTFQRLEMVGTLTALENVQLAAEAQPAKLAAGRTPAAVAHELLERVGAGGVADHPADTLPTGSARLVEVARALACSPRLLLLDEPGSGLDPSESAALGRVIRELAADGVGVLLVEHDMGLVMDTCDHVVVLDYGRVIADGDPAAVRADPAVTQAYLGSARAAGSATTPTTPTTPATANAAVAAGAAEAPGTDGPAPAVVARPVSTDGGAGPSAGPAAPALVVEDVRAAYGRIEVLHGVSLRVEGGTVCALLGPNGAGKSTLLKVISGSVAPTAGTVAIGGEPVQRPRPARLARDGICCIPEGRAVFPNLTVTENLLMYTYRGAGTGIRQLEEQTFERFPHLALRRRQLAGTLSGGEQQMLALARALFTGPRVLLLDEISMGLAPLVVDELYDTVRQVVAREQLTVLVVEQFAQMALSIASQAAVMVHGEIVRTGAPAEIDAYLAEAYMGAVPPSGS